MIVFLESDFPSIMAHLIESPQNQTIKSLARLKERRYRKFKRQYLIEGSKEVKNALMAKVAIEKIFICWEVFDSNFALPTNLPIIELSLIAFKKLSYRDKPEGVIALANMQKMTLSELNLPKNPLLLAVDGVEKPGNLGALLRTANATNIDAIFLIGEGTDFYNPNVIRSSIGCLFSQKILEIETSRLIQWLKSKGIKIVATSPQAELPYWEVSYRAATIIVLGAENQGLGEVWLKSAEVAVKIPMLGIVDSLNVATSGALLMYETLRQRFFSQA